MKPFFVVLFASLLLCRLSDLRGATGDSSSSDALSLIDGAAWNERRIPSYSTTSYQVNDGCLITTKTYVRNDSDGSRLCRVERTVSQPGSPLDTFICISNRAGLWLIHQNNITRLSQEPQFHRPVPRRLSTPYPLGLKDELKYTVERGLDYFGVRATRVTISLSQDAINRLIANPSIMQDALERQHRPPTGLAKIDAASAFPVTYVYFVAEKPAFMLSWQAFALTGKKCFDVSDQEFSSGAVFPDALFETPGMKPLGVGPAGHK